MERKKWRERLKYAWRRGDIKNQTIPKADGTKLPTRRTNGLEDDIKVFINNMWRCRPYWIVSDAGKITGSCENGSEPSDAIKGDEICKYFSDYSLLNVEPVSCFSNHFLFLGHSLFLFSSLIHSVITGLNREALVAGLSPWNPGFDPRPVRLQFVVGKLTVV